MRTIAIIVAVALVLVAAAAAQEGGVEIWTGGASCPPDWTQIDSRPAVPTRYKIEIRDGYFAGTNQAALDASYTVDGVLDAVSRDAAITAGTVQMEPGEPGMIRCRWRPLGGTP